MTDTPSLPEPIRGKYTIIRPLGAGAMGKVYLVKSPDVDVPVALKLIDFGQGKSQSGERRLRKLFRTEANVARKLDHPNIIKIYEADIIGSQAYMVMDFIDGRALDHFAKFKNLLPPDKVVAIIFKCCMALDHAYRQGVLHRDLKPANIMVDKQWNVKIMDFGLALNFANKENEGSTFITGVGSPAFMSPEQIKSYPLNQQSDIYAIGVVLYQLLTGRLPFKGSNPAQTIYKIINTEAIPVTTLNPMAPVKMDQIVQKALEKDLYTRYRNGAEMAQDLSAVRFRIIDDSFVERDNAKFLKLRKMPILYSLDEVELWELLRMGNFRKFPAGYVWVQEGSTQASFGIVLSGQISVWRNNAMLFELGAGSFIGEETVLDKEAAAPHQVTIRMREEVELFEISPASYNLATEEVAEKVNGLLVKAMLRRFELLSATVTPQESAEPLPEETQLPEEPLATDESELRLIESNPGVKTVAPAAPAPARAPMAPAVAPVVSAPAQVPTAPAVAPAVSAPAQVPMAPAVAPSVPPAQPASSTASTDMLAPLLPPISSMESSKSSTSMSSMPQQAIPSPIASTSASRQPSGFSSMASGGSPPAMQPKIPEPSSLPVLEAAPPSQSNQGFPALLDSKGADADPQEATMPLQSRPYIPS